MGTREGRVYYILYTRVTIFPMGALFPGCTVRETENNIWFHTTQRGMVRTKNEHNNLYMYIKTYKTHIFDSYFRISSRMQLRLFTSVLLVLHLKMALLAYPVISFHTKGVVT